MGADAKLLRCAVCIILLGKLCALSVPTAALDYPRTFCRRRAQGGILVGNIENFPRQFLTGEKKRYKSFAT